MNRFAWIVTVPIALLVILFALMNRQNVSLSLWPLPWDVTAPLFLFTLGAVLFGFFFGALSTWASGGSTRQKLRAANRALAEARDELAHVKRQHMPKEQQGKTEPALAHRPRPAQPSTAQPPTALPPAA